MSIVERHLRLFQAEVELASGAFYTWRSIDDHIKKDSGVLATVNRTPLVWNTFQSSNRTAFLIAIGRIFDTDGDAFSLTAFLNACIEHIQEFSRTALRERRLRDVIGNPPDWFESYIAAAEEPLPRVFQDLKRASRPFRAKYEEIYKPIRHKVIAHRDLQFIEKAEEHFQRTDIRDIEAMLTFFSQVEGVVFQWLHNGRRSQLRDHEVTPDPRYSNDVTKLLDAVDAGILRD
jgi:hypothetical protein